MRMAPIMETGKAIANQASQDGAVPSADMRSIAKMFWGLLMGLVIPPKLLARAIPAGKCWSHPNSGGFFDLFSLVTLHLWRKTNYSQTSLSGRPWELRTLVAYNVSVAQRECDITLAQWTGFSSI